MQLPGYQIVRKINQGGMSTVYLAIQKSVGREVALKIMSPALNADPIFTERFQREANIVGQLSHPHIISIYDIGNYKGINYIAMDFLPGGSIHDKITAGLSPQEAVRILREISGALDYAHNKGYVHRDIKPENILFRDDGSAILSDFGVARTVSNSGQMTNAGTVVGTPHYMSPEQARGRNTDGRSDIYSLGVVFYEMLTGSVPYKGEEAVAIAIKHLTSPVPKLPSQFSLYQNLLNKMMAKDANERFQRGGEITEAIDELTGNVTNNHPSYLTNTEPTGVQVYDLAKALALTTYGAMLNKIRNLFVRGSDRTEQFSDIGQGRTDTIIANRTTAVNAQADYGQSVTATKKSNKWWLRGFLVFMLAVFSLPVWWHASFPGKKWLSDSLPEPLTAGLGTANRWLWQSVTAATTAAAPESSYAGASDTPPTAATPQSTPESTNVVRENEQEFSFNPDSEVMLQPEFTTSEPSESMLVDNTFDGNETIDEVVEEIAPEPTPTPLPKYSFSIETVPAEATIRILNIRPRYQTGMLLPRGAYHIEISAADHVTYTQWIKHRAEQSLRVELIRIYKPGDEIKLPLASGGFSPLMQALPAGSFAMGDERDKQSRPSFEANVPQPFAASETEITYDQFDEFSSATGYPQIEPGSTGRGKTPVVNITWQQATDYVEWLTAETGYLFRLPTETEWEYLSRANTTGKYWWKGTSAATKANCRRGCKSKFSSAFSVKVAPVASYPAKPFWTL